LKCTICDLPLEKDDQPCPSCQGLEGKVQVLTKAERQEFDGITLEQEEKQETAEGYHYHASGQRQYNKSFSIHPTSLFTKVVVGVIFATLVVVMLPVALFLIGIAIISLYFFRK